MKPVPARRTQPWITILTLAALLLACTVPAFAGSKSAATAQVVDSGSFGIFVRGQRVATESFTIKQFPDYSMTSSELKLGDGKTAQTSEMQLLRNGDLRRYEWHEVNPGKAASTVEPKDQFLIQRIIGTDKPIEQPYLMPASSVILDDYFFSQREVLLWRYLAAGCQIPAGASGCPLPKAQFGVIIPRQRTSSVVTVAFVTREKVMIRGQERELSRFNIGTDGDEWGLWLDDDKKMVRIVIASSETEVLRD